MYKLFLVFAVIFSNLSVSALECTEFFYPSVDFPQGWVLNEESASQANRYPQTRELFIVLREAIEEFQKLSEADFRDLSLMLAKNPPKVDLHPKISRQGSANIAVKFFEDFITRTSRTRYSRDFPLEFWKDLNEGKDAPTKIEILRYEQMRVFLDSQFVSAEATLLLSSALAEIAIPNRQKLPTNIFSKNSNKKDLLNDISAFLTQFGKIHGSVPSINSIRSSSELFSNLVEAELNKTMDSMYSSGDRKFVPSKKYLRAVDKRINKLTKAKQWEVFGVDALRKYIYFVVKTEKFLLHPTKAESLFVNFLERDLVKYDAKIFDFFYDFYRFFFKRIDVPTPQKTLKDMVAEGLRQSAKALRTRVVLTEVMEKTDESITRPYIYRLNGNSVESPQSPQGKSKKRRKIEQALIESARLEQGITTSTGKEEKHRLLSELTLETQVVGEIYEVKKFVRDTENLLGVQRVRISESVIKDLIKRKHNLKHWVEAFSLGMARVSRQSGIKQMRIRSGNRDWWEIKIANSDWRVIMERRPDGIWHWLLLESHKNVDKAILNL